MKIDDFFYNIEDKHGYDLNRKKYKLKLNYLSKLKYYIVYKKKSLPLIIKAENKTDVLNLLNGLEYIKTSIRELTDKNLINDYELNFNNCNHIDFFRKYNLISGKEYSPLNWIDSVLRGVKKSIKLEKNNKDIYIFGIDDNFSCPKCLRNIIDFEQNKNSFNCTCSNCNFNFIAKIEKD